MSRSKTPPPPAASAAQIVTLLDTAAAGPTGARETLAARHYQRGRGRRASVREASHDEPTGGAAPAGDAEEGTPPQVYFHGEPTISYVFNAFLNQLNGPGTREVARTDVSHLDDVRLALRLLDLARQFIPRAIEASGNVEVAMELMQWIEPNPKARDPWLYIRSAMKAGGGLGLIARDFDAQRQLIEHRKGDRKLASCMLAAFAGRLFAHAASAIGYHAYEELALSIRNNLSDKMRRPAVRVTSVSSPAGRRRSGSGSG